MRIPRVRFSIRDMIISAVIAGAGFGLLARAFPPGSHVLRHAQVSTCGGMDVVDQISDEPEIPVPDGSDPTEPE
jgi:hypothetical protein